MDFSELMSDDENISLINYITSEKRGGGDTDLSIEDSGINEQTIEMYIGSGINFQTYRIEVMITTDQNNILQGDGLLKVTNK
jgi:hypothetical protein